MNYVGFRRFVKNHERGLVIAGSILAVVSLLAKEIVRDDVKDFRDALSAAKTMFIVNSGFVGIHQQIGALPGERSTPAFDPDVSAEEREQEYRVVAAIESFEAQVDDMETLLEVMHPSDHDKLMLTETKNDEGTVEREIERVMRIEDKKARMAQLSKLEESATELEQKAFHWQGELLNEADAEQRSRNQTYELVNHLTFGLIVLGALLGLLGQIFNVKGLEKVG